VPAFLNYDDGSLIKGLRAIRKNCRETLDDIARAGVVKSENDRARIPAAGQGCHLAEIEIKGEYDPYLTDSFREDLTVGRSAEVNLFLGEPRCVFESLLNILGYEVRVVAQDLLNRCAMSNVPHDDGNRDPHSADACTPSHDPRVESDPIEFHLPLRT